MFVKYYFDGIYVGKTEINTNKYCGFKPYINIECSTTKCLSAYDILIDQVEIKPFIDFSPEI
jgi:hypothetical protein